MNILKTIGAVVLVALVAAGGCVACAHEAVQRSYDQCDRAFNEWVMTPAGTPQPEILLEDWCIDHLIDSAKP